MIVDISELATKAKELGKGLSEANYTEKEKLSTIHPNYFWK